MACDGLVLIMGLMYTVPMYIIYNGIRGETGMCEVFSKCGSLSQLGKESGKLNILGQKTRIYRKISMNFF